MDIDKDGTISKNDIRAAFDNVGKLMSEGELDDMLAEVGGACTFDAMIKMFQAKMAGGKNRCCMGVHLEVNVLPSLPVIYVSHD